MDSNLIVEFIAFCIGLLIWRLAFNLAVALFSQSHQSKDNKRAELEDQLTTLIHVVLPETQGNIVYWFDRDTNAFLGQGTTDSEIISQVKSRFPTHIFIVDDGQKALRAPTWEFVPFENILEPAAVNDILDRAKL
jgi:hypothetical protein